MEKVVHYELIVAGHRTGVKADADSVNKPPTVEAFRTPAGLIYGNTEQVSSGAITNWVSDGFVFYKGKFQFIKENLTFDQRVGETILMMPEVDGPSRDACAEAAVYRLGKLTKIGLVRRATILKDGSVIGWYPMVNGKPYRSGMYGDTSPAETPGYPVEFTRRYFKWKNGKRLEGDKPFGQMKEYDESGGYRLP